MPRAPGGTIEVHTQWNTQTINNYQFGLTQERIPDAHNVATGPLAPSDGTLRLAS